jgi:hypothetical protein
MSLIRVIEVPMIANTPDTGRMTNHRDQEEWFLVTIPSSKDSLRMVYALDMVDLSKMMVPMRLAPTKMTNG